LKAKDLKRGAVTRRNYGVLKESTQQDESSDMALERSI
jgi:hypothetical protein